MVFVGCPCVGWIVGLLDRRGRGILVLALIIILVEKRLCINAESMHKVRATAQLTNYYQLLPTITNYISF